VLTLVNQLQFLALLLFLALLPQLQQTRKFLRVQQQKSLLEPLLLILRTKTTTETKTQNLSYDKNTVTSNTVTNTTTNITNNVTNQTTNINNSNKTETTSQDPPKADFATDTPLGDLPKLYERKYPDGLSGIWDLKSQQLKQTQIVSFANQLLPQFNGGSCPSWTIDLELASWANFGVQNVSPDCAVWDWARIIILVSALILARALVFGG